MTWVKLDDNHQDHPKVVGLSDRAYRLWVRTIAHSNAFGLCGVISLNVLRQISAPIRAKTRHKQELIDAQLWHVLDDGIRVHDIEDYQLAPKKAANISTIRSEAGKKGAAARWGGDGNLPLAKNAPSPSRPVPAQPSPIDSAIQKVWQFWLTKKPATKRQVLKKTHPEYRLIKKRLADYSVEDIRKAIDGMFADKWSVDNGKLDLSWALRQDEKNNNMERFTEPVNAPDGTGQPVDPNMPFIPQELRKERMYMTIEEQDKFDAIMQPYWEEQRRRKRGLAN